MMINKRLIGERIMRIKKMLHIILGCAGVGLDAVGAVLPLLPAFPFLMLAAYCFAEALKS